MRYSTTTINVAAKTQHAKDKLGEGFDLAAAYDTVKAEIFMPEYKADFVALGKKPILENFVQMPKITLEDVVRDFVSQQQN